MVSLPQMNGCCINDNLSLLKCTKTPGACTLCRLNRVTAVSRKKCLTLNVPQRNKMNIRFFFSVAIAIACVQAGHAQQKAIQLYNGAAPKSEKWTWTEKQFFDHNTTLIYDVSHPSLEVFLPPDSLANGTSVIICPGGGFYLLEIENEGRNIARWLNSMGIAAFVLKYRLMKTQTDNPQEEMFAKAMNTDKLAIEADTVINMAINDIATAMIQVKSAAKVLKINPAKIGIIGFSAGGTLAAAMAYNYTPETRPAFVAAIYPWVAPVRKKTLQTDAPPLFIAAASDDQLGFNIGSAEMYLDWVRSKRSAELHLYSKGGHGFVAFKSELPVSTWKDRFTDWLKLNDDQNE
ncbi:MAG: alpha/beta hydrolase [Chitinophagaceae bacterium]|nr:MAG: alpha/beta hydrolase [Chitinophagaceae bacterium]